MLKIIAIVVVVAIVAVLGLAALKPNTFRIQRATTIKAPPEKIFALIDDFHAWGSWSPWEKVDPSMTRTYSGTGSGKGAVYAWEGNRDIGQGRMEITEMAPPSRVVIKLDFLAPLEAHNTAEFTLNPKGDSTDVTWAMYGPNSFVGKLIGVFLSMDKMVGGMFETGLANLKTVAEKGA